VAATHRDLVRLVQEEKFREDLFYRINTVSLLVPPLRERGRDVVLLARSFMARIGSELGRPGVRLSEGAESALGSRSWPGNIRQLRNVLEQAVLLSERTILEAEDLRDTSVPAVASARPRASLVEAERQHIEAMLQEEKWSVPRTATTLGLSRSALYEKIRKHGIRLPSSGR
jgi:DNA-binding NtrC family response regulator